MTYRRERPTPSRNTIQNLRDFSSRTRETTRERSERDSERERDWTPRNNKEKLSLEKKTLDRRSVYNFSIDVPRTTEERALTQVLNENRNQQQVGCDCEATTLDKVC